MPVQYNNNLAEWAKKLVGDMSLRQVEIKTGVTYSTTKNILDGRVPEATILIRFAGAFGEDIPRVLRMAGYDDIADLWEQGTRNTQAEVDQSSHGELTYELAEDVEEAMSYYNGIPDDLKPGAKEILRQMFEMNKRLDEGKVIGRRVTDEDEE